MNVNLILSNSEINLWLQIIENNTTKNDTVKGNIIWLEVNRLLEF